MDGVLTVKSVRIKNAHEVALYDILVKWDKHSQKHDYGFKKKIPHRHSPLETETFLYDLCSHTEMKNMKKGIVYQL